MSSGEDVVGNLGGILGQSQVLDIAWVGKEQVGLVLSLEWVVDKDPLDVVAVVVDIKVNRIPPLRDADQNIFDRGGQMLVLLGACWRVGVVTGGPSAMAMLLAPARWDSLTNSSNMS